jgi:hypothetical protein
MGSRQFSQQSFQIDMPQNAMGTTRFLKVRFISPWKFWQGDNDVSATFKIINEHGLSHHFGDTDDLNLESVAPK